MVCIDTFPSSHVGDTSASSRRDFDAYDCAPGTDESGAEVLYRVTIPANGLLSLELTDMETGADVDVHLLGSESSSDCIARGHWVAGGYVQAGHYWVVADTWTSGATEYDGQYRMNFGFMSVDDLEEMGLDEAPAEDALYAMGVAFENGDPDTLFYAITDFSMHSADRRMWILDLIDGTLLWNLHVTHGENSSTGSEAYATSFSNINDSHQSSLGMMKAAELYTSSTVGPGLRLDGLEPGYNDNVRMRGIVVHGATYARAENVASWGVAGTSWGCPAVDDRLVDDVMDTLTGGGMMFFWYPDGDWSSFSGYLD